MEAARRERIRAGTREGQGRKRGAQHPHARTPCGTAIVRVLSGVYPVWVYGF